MTARVDTEGDESQIRALVAKWAEAVRNRNATALTSGFAPDVVMFDLIEPLRYAGKAAVAERAQQWLSSFKAPPGYEVRDLKVTAGDDVAFCHSLNRVVGTTHQGTQIDMWWRATVCFQKVEGNWVVTHEHSSVPFNMQSGEASLNLNP